MNEPHDPNVTTGVGPASTTVAVPLPATQRYTLGDEIARGGMGIVFRATDTTLGREVAVKVLKDQYGPESGVARRFADEARITSQLQHPSIPPVHDLGTLPDGRPFLAMKLIKGQTLEELLIDRPDPGAERGRFVAVFEQMCQALAYAHSHQVIHRDLKPANVMVGNFGEVQVMDWGLAKVLQIADCRLQIEECEGSPGTTASYTPQSEICNLQSEKTQAGTVLGTPAFMPPEQAVGALGKVDARSDVFGLGAVLAVILTGKPPFAAASAETTRVKAAQGDVAECLAQLDACGAEPDLVALCKRCLSPNPTDRPSDAGAVAQAVAELRVAAEERARHAELARVRVEGEKALAEAREAEQRKRRRVQAALGIAFTALVVLGGAFAWWVQDQRRTRQEQAEREVNQAVATAEARYAQAKGADRDLALWAEARAAALQARERAAEAAPEVRERIEQLLAEIDRVEKNRRLVATLLDIQASMGDTVENDTSQDFSGASARYEQAFRDYGADLGRLPPEGAADLLRNLGAGSTVQLAAALDDWAYVRYQDKWQTLGYSGDGRAVALREVPRLFRVTSLLDADPFRNRIRGAVAARDMAELRRLAEECDPATQPVQTVNLISVWHYNLNDDATSEVAFLRRAYSHYPGDFQINHNLAYLYNRFNRRPEAQAHSMAAIGVRPQSSAAWLDYAMAMAAQGRYEEAAAGYRRVAELSPRTWAFRAEAGAALDRLGRQVEAVAEHKKALSIVLQFQDLNSAALSVAVAGWKKHGLFDEFRTGLLKARGLGPNSAQAHRRLGDALKASGDVDEAIACYQKAIELSPKDAATHYSLGNALQGKGQLDEAIASYRNAIALDPKYAEAQCNLGHILASQGRFAESLAALKRGHELGTQQSGWRYPSAQWVRQAEAKAALEAKLPAFLQGEFQPVDNKERLVLLLVCQAKKLHHTATGLYAAAFAADPTLADGLQIQHRYNAACFAALAAAGQGEDAAKLDDKERTRLRQQALDWLKADLALRTKQLETGQPADRAAVQQQMLPWQKDTDLAGIRDAAAMAKLPADEQKAFTQLWADVAALLKKAQP